MKPKLTLHDLFWLVLLVVLAGGCLDGSKARQIQNGAESVDEHAKRIEKAAEPRP